MTLGLHPVLRPDPLIHTAPQPHPSPYSTPSSVSSSSSSSSSSTQCLRIGSLWREYQGARNWDGLLDPLDHTLCSELLRYGRFVQGAYSCFESSPSLAACPFPKCSLLSRCGLPDTGYRVTRNLHATSSIQLPRWAEERAPSWVSNQSSWIGYVAVCQDEGEIARLGRRDVVIALRGTTTCLEWLENFRTTLTDVAPGDEEEPAPADGECCRPMVETGFWSLYNSSSLTHRSLREEIRQEVLKLIGRYCRKDMPPLSLTVSGHSLGAALAVLAAYDITTTFRHAPLVTVISFGGPRVGNASFRRAVEASGSKVLRIVNPRDIITKVPGFVVDDAASSEENRLWSSWLSKAGWAYSDVGRELRVSSPTANVAECHDLNLYLQLLDELSSSVRPLPGRRPAPSERALSLEHFMRKQHPRTHDDAFLCT